MSQRRANSWIQTFSGRRFYPLSPRASEVYIEDIAHALALQCRWTGHCREFFSVAQHSVLVSYATIGEGVDKLWGLLHDASEAYLVDLARPVKRDPRMGFFKTAEKRIQKVIAERFNLPWPIPEDIHRADTILLLTERRDLLPHVEWSHESMRKWQVNVYAPLSEKLRPWDWREAEKQFLIRFRVLTCRK